MAVKIDNVHLETINFYGIVQILFKLKHIVPGLIKWPAKVFVSLMKLMFDTGKLEKHFT